MDKCCLIVLLCLIPRINNETKAKLKLKITTSTTTNPSSKAQSYLIAAPSTFNLGKVMVDLVSYPQTKASAVD